MEFSLLQGKHPSHNQPFSLLRAFSMTPRVMTSEKKRDAQVAMLKKPQLSCAHPALARAWE